MAWRLVCFFIRHLWAVGYIKVVDNVLVGLILHFAYKI